MAAIRNQAKTLCINIKFCNDALITYNIKFLSGRPDQSLIYAITGLDKDYNDQDMLDLLDLHLSTMLSEMDKSFVSCECDDPQTIKSIFDMFVKYKINCFKFRDNEVTRKCSHYHLKIGEKGDLNFIDHSLLYNVVYCIPKEKKRDDQITQLIGKLKLIGINASRTSNLNIETSPSLKAVTLSMVGLESIESCTHLSNMIMFADSLVLKPFEMDTLGSILKYSEMKKTTFYRFFQTIFNSSIRHLEIDFSSNVDLGHDTPFTLFLVKGLTSMTKLRSLKIKGADKTKADLTGLITRDNSRIQVFESEFQMNREQIQRMSHYFKTHENHSIYSLSLSIFDDSYKNRDITQVIKSCPNLTLLKLIVGKETSTRSLDPYVFDKTSNKLSQIMYKPDFQGQDQTFWRISQLNNFKRYFLVEPEKEKVVSSLKYYKNIFYKSGTIAHYYAKKNRVDLCDDEHLKHLEQVQDLKRNWLPSTYLSLHGNPKVKTMFAVVRKDQHFVALDHRALIRMFEFIGDSIWDENIFCSINRVNAQFYKSALIYRKIIENKIREKNKMELIDEQSEKINAVQQLKHRKAETIVFMEERNAKRRKM